MADHRTHLLGVVQESIPFSRPQSPSLSQNRIGWVGLGSMGYPMAKNIANHSEHPNHHPLLIHNRSREKTFKLKEELGDKVLVADSLEQIALDSDIIFTSLATDEAVRAVYQSFHSALKACSRFEAD